MKKNNLCTTELRTADNCYIRFLHGSFQGSGDEFSVQTHNEDNSNI